MTSKPYFMSEVTDGRDENRQNPNRDATEKELKAAGVVFKKILMDDNWENKLEELAKEFDMNYRDCCEINRTNFPDFDEKLRIFFSEHLHTDPEVRFVKSGRGYFDIRSASDEWIRIPVTPGDFVFLPAGIYHRFTTDHDESIVAIRLFGTRPKWEAYNRSDEADKFPTRVDYLQNIRA